MRNSKSDPTRYKNSQIVLAIILVGLLIVAGIAMFVVYRTLEDDKKAPEVQTTTQEQIVPEIAEEDVEQLPEAKQFDAASLQNTLDTWIHQSGGTAGVVVMDTDGKVLATHGQDRSFFTASIYKLFVAYEGYRLVDAGERSFDEQFLNGQTLGECLDLMIRESDSPCAEKLWTELGRAELTQTLKSYGIADTNMVSLSTTSSDVAKILKRIATSEGLSSESQQKLLASMREQIYRDALNKGFSADVTVYNKIGFNEQIEYHDTAIIELADGRKLIVSVLTDNIGTRKIAALGAALEAVLGVEQ